MINMACAIIFIIFVFCYVYFFQCDLFTLAQHLWSGGKTTFNPFVGASILTSILFIIQMGIKTVIQLPPSVQALTYFPSLLFLGVITSESVNEQGILSIGHWWWMSILLLVVYLIVLQPLRELSSFQSTERNFGLFSRTAWINFAILSALMLMTLGISNTDRALHRQLRMENLIANGEYEKAAKMNIDEADCNAYTTMMRAYALSKQGKLGENFFNYPVKGGSLALIPHSSDGKKCGHDGTCQWKFTDNTFIWYNIGCRVVGNVTNTRSILYQIRNVKKATPQLNDYLFTACLIDCDLKGFVKEVTTVCDTTKLHTLARHYREALVLSSHTMPELSVNYQDNVLDADFEDFQALTRKKFQTPAKRDSALYETYNGTYWYYYYKNKAK